MLILTDVFGPLITITVKMMGDLLIFFVLFAIELVAFACVGILSFGNLKEYSDLNTTLVMFYESALGNWDFSIYDDGKMSVSSRCMSVLKLLMKNWNTRTQMPKKSISMLYLKLIDWYHTLKAYL